MTLPAFFASTMAVCAAACSVLGVRAWSLHGAHRRLPVPLVLPAATSRRWRRRFDHRARWLAAGAVIAMSLALPWPLPLVVPLGAGGAVAIRRVFAARARAIRRHAIDAEVPQLLDLLAAGSSAGLAAPLALARAGEVLRGPLASEVRALARAVHLGARWRDELAALADRTEVPDLRRAVSVLARTETLGTSLREATEELASAVRRTRRALVMERARAAPVKMLFPLVFLVLPAFLLLTVVPVLLTTVQSIR